MARDVAGTDLQQGHYVALRHRVVEPDLQLADHARGRILITMDGDLQNDPADIPMLLDKIEKEPWDMIAGNRVNRHLELADNGVRVERGQALGRQAGVRARGHDDLVFPIRRDGDQF